MALQVPVNHEDLVAAGVGAGPFPDLLVVLLDVLLKPRREESITQTGRPSATLSPGPWMGEHLHVLMQQGCNNC